jgi:hypothetical protein
MASAVRKRFFGSTLLLLSLGAFFPGYTLETRFVDPGSVRARVVNKLFADHLKSFAALEGLLEVYLTSFRGALQESLVVQSQWIDELKGSGDLAGEPSGSESGGTAAGAAVDGSRKGAAAGGYFLHGAGKGLRFYIDGEGAFHFVSVFGGGKTRSDIVIGFDPLREAIAVMTKKPRGVVLLDEKNGTESHVYRRGRRKVGKWAPGDSPDGIDIRFSRIGSVRFVKGFSLDGDGLLLVSEYDILSVQSRFVLFGLFIVFTLAILVMVSTGASLFGGISAGGRKMSGKPAEDDIVGEIDREISAGVFGPKRPEGGKETPVTEVEDAGGEETEGAVASIDSGLEKTERAAAPIDSGLEETEGAAASIDLGLEKTEGAAAPIDLGLQKTEGAAASIELRFEETPAVPEETPRVVVRGRSKGRGKALENDGIIIKKS